MPEDTVRAEATQEAMSLEHVTVLWDGFRDGRVVICARDGGSMAANVDCTMGTYRLVCVSCGHATPWFECKPGTGVRLRGTSSIPPGE